MLITPTGGLIYHARALRFSAKRWAPFRREVATWLEGWQPRERALLLVGPSGGYSLSEEFLRRFETVSAIDPDPLSRYIFSLRLGVAPQWSSRTDLGPRQGRFRPEGIAPL